MVAYHLPSTEFNFQVMPAKCLRLKKEECRIHKERKIHLRWLTVSKLSRESTARAFISLSNLFISRRNFVLHSVTRNVATATQAHEKLPYKRSCLTGPNFKSKTTRKKLWLKVSANDKTNNWHKMFFITK